jgi:D-alanyl-D-alanine carboxypeptidase
MNGEEWFNPAGEDLGDDGGVWAPDVAADSDGYDPSDDPASNPVPENPPSPARGVPTLPVSPAKIPGWVKQFENGRLTPDSLIKVAPIGGGFLIPEAAAAWRTLQLAAQQAGFNLTMSGGYRSYDRQVAMFQERYTTTDIGGPSKQWNNTTYWQRPNVAMAATPGRSNHGWGAAVDMALGGYGTKSAQNVLSNSSFIEWIVPRAKSFGWSWEVQSEAWHIRLISDGQPSRPGGGGASAMSEPAHSAHATTHPVPSPPLVKGMEGGQVAALQKLCMWFGWATFTRADGKFGDLTLAAVKAMQLHLAVNDVEGEFREPTAEALSRFLNPAPR